MKTCILGLLILTGGAQATCGLEISAEYVYWKAFNSALFWADLRGNIAFQFQLRSRRSISADYQSGIGVAARYRLPCSCWSAIARYHWVRPTGSASYVLALPFTTQFAVTTRPPNIPGTRVVSELYIPYHAVEGLLSYAFVCGRCLELSVLGGAAFISLQHNYSDRVVFPAPLRRPGCITDKFTGVGPAIGLSGLAGIWAGFRVSGELLLTGLIGRKENGALTVFTTQVIQGEFTTLTQVVPSLIYRGGVGWHRRWCQTQFSVDLGWEQRSYLETTTIPSASPVAFETTIGDVHIGGPYLGAAISF